MGKAKFVEGGAQMTELWEMLRMLSETMAIKG